MDKLLLGGMDLLLLLTANYWCDRAQRAEHALEHANQTIRDMTRCHANHLL